MTMHTEHTEHHDHGWASSLGVQMALAVVAIGAVIALAWYLVF
jgi:hypothetical protein